MIPYGYRTSLNMDITPFSFDKTVYKGFNGLEKHVVRFCLLLIHLIREFVAALDGDGLTVYLSLPTGAVTHKENCFIVFNIKRPVHLADHVMYLFHI